MSLAILLQQPFPVDELDPNTLACMEKLGCGVIISEILDYLREEGVQPSNEILNVFEKMLKMFGIWRELHSCLQNMQEGLGDFSYRYTRWSIPGLDYIWPPSADVMHNWLVKFRNDLLIIRASKLQEERNNRLS